MYTAPTGEVLLALEVAYSPPAGEVALNLTDEGGDNDRVLSANVTLPAATGGAQLEHALTYYAQTDAQLQAASGGARLNRVFHASTNAALQADTGGMVARYDNAVFRGSCVSVGAAWGEGSQISAATELAHSSADPLHVITHAAHNDAVALSGGTEIASQSGLPLQQSSALAWAHGVAVTTETAARHDYPAPANSSTRAAWGEGAQVQAQFGLVYPLLVRLDRPLVHTWRDAVAVIVTVRSSARIAEACTKTLIVPWRAAQALFGVSAPSPIPQPPAPDLPVGFVALNVACPVSTDGAGLILELRVATCPAARTVVVPIRRTYVMLNTASLKLLPDNIELPCLGMRISIDLGSWCWSLSAELSASAWPILQGSTLTVEATVNGNIWLFAVDSVKPTWRFGQNALQLSARSRTALLTQLDASDYEAGSPITAQQLALALLNFTGVDLDWRAVDWTLPSYSHQGLTPLAAISNLAQVAGAALQSAPADDELIVLPRWPVTPWNLVSAVPDLVIPRAALLELAHEKITVVEADRIFVSGTTSGVLAQVTRAGLAGVHPVREPIVDALITSQDVARARAEAELSERSSRTQYTFTVPLSVDHPLITAGSIVQLQLAENDERNTIAQSVSISATRSGGGSLVVRQQAEVWGYV